MKLVNGKHAQVVYMFCIAFVLAFSLYTSIVTISANKQSLWCKSAAFTAFIAALVLAVDRDTYLPFLNNAVFPSSLVKSVYSPPGANVEAVIIVDEKDGTKIAYWGAKPLYMNGATIPQTPQEAYANYSNAGVAEVKNGQAILKFFCPSKYNINNIYPWATTLDRHVHYRVIDSHKHKGMMSPVYTKWVKC